jgi:hypothetical protein
MVDHDDDTDYVRLAEINGYTMFTTDDDDEVDAYGPYGYSQLMRWMMIGVSSLQKYCMVVYLAVSSHIYIKSCTWSYAIHQEQPN